MVSNTETSIPGTDSRHAEVGVKSDSMNSKPFGFGCSFFNLRLPVGCAMPASVGGLGVQFFLPRSGFVACLPHPYAYSCKTFSILYLTVEVCLLNLMSLRQSVQLSYLTLYALLKHGCIPTF